MTTTSTEEVTQRYDAEELEKSLLKTPFVKEAIEATEPITTPLRICCYGSSSATTPAKFLKEAWNLGYILARRGHTCVNGAGSYGCMAAMNDGADAGNGHIVGVIHEMFIVDGNDWYCNRDGGAHRLFHNTAGSKPKDANSVGPRREILVAGGKDLQERKRLLVKDANGLVVLPGGPGTWDELWEMACSRNLGLTNLPIVCVSVDGFYESFRTMLELAHAEGLVKNRPEDVVHFVKTPEEAVRWIEQWNAKDVPAKALPSAKVRASYLRRSSFFSTPFLSRSASWFSEPGGDDVDGLLGRLKPSTIAGVIGAVAFVAGVSVGLVSSSRASSRFGVRA